MTNINIEQHLNDGAQCDDKVSLNSGESTSQSSDFRFYIIHVYSGMEKFVQKSLKERVAQAGMQDLFGRILVPVEEVMEVKSGKKSLSERKNYPGYVFVEMVMSDDTWHLVKNTSKVTGFVGGARNKPSPIPRAEVQRILSQIEHGTEKPKPKVAFEVGESIRVKEGPFADFTGTVEDVNYEKSRLAVTVTIFGRSTPVELGFDQVEKL